MPCLTGVAPLPEMREEWLCLALVESCSLTFVRLHYFATRDRQPGISMTDVILRTHSDCVEHQAISNDLFSEAVKMFDGHNHEISVLWYASGILEDFLSRSTVAPSSSELHNIRTTHVPVQDSRGNSLP